MPWLLSGPFLLLLLGVAVFFPYTAARTALQNARHPDGVRSRRRTRREVRRLLTFLREAVLVPCAVLVFVLGSTFIIHYYVVPEDTTLGTIFGAAHPDVAVTAPALDAWYEAMELAEQNRNLAEEEHMRVLDYNPAEGTFGPFGDLLVEHWPIHLVILLIPPAYLAFFFRWRFMALSRSYNASVSRRAKRYALHSAVSDERSRSSVGVVALRPHRQGY